ncbi:MAG: 4Fe-4S binding protein [Firmicutes bacterium]|nr:4Fe-4S binding protein [Bacillota bacterium]
MKREIIKIDEEKCNGCGLCIPNCPEGALQVIDGKVRLISDLFCDGLGACIGFCPQGAINIEKREAGVYDERKVMENIVRQGANVIKQHLEHLNDHNQTKYLNEARDYLKEKNITVSFEEKTQEVNLMHESGFSGCPGSRMMDFSKESGDSAGENARVESQLRQWPIQLHLISPTAPYYEGKDVLLAADCTAYALGNFHQDYLKGRSIAIACPKLDEGQEYYVEKIKSWFEDAKINTLTILMMQVPCCMGLLNIANEALQASSRKVPIKYIVVSLKGEILEEKWA